MHENILILDFGSQYTQLIARRIREQSVFCEIFPFNESLDKIKEIDPDGIVLSGGPMSIYEDGAPQISKEVLELGVPVLGICYGLCVLAKHNDGVVAQSDKREYGRAELEILDDSDLFAGIKNNSQVWMSHADRLDTIPEGFEVIGQ
ncbi:glutamine-hydrolyzing GMP synthase, partial [candidate division KSB1 bacterium]